MAKKVVRVLMKVMTLSGFSVLAGCGVFNPYVIARDSIHYKAADNCWERVGIKWSESRCRNGEGYERARHDLDACFNSLYRTAKFKTSEDEASQKLFSCMGKKGWVYYGTGAFIT